MLDYIIIGRLFFIENVLNKVTFESDFAFKNKKMVNEIDLRILGIDYFLYPFALLIIGFVLAILSFVLEYLQIYN